MEPAAARRTLASLRFGIGVSALAAPGLMGKSFGISMADNPAGPYLARMFGAREIFMALPHLVDMGFDERQLATMGIAVDASDAWAALAAGRAGQLPWRAALPAALTAGIATVLGFQGAAEDPAPVPAAAV